MLNYHLAGLLGFDEIFFARPIATPLLIAAIVAIVALSIYLYRKGWGLPLWQRIALGLARLVALAIVVFTLLEPTGVKIESNTKTKKLPVVIDVSESMSMVDPRKNKEDVAKAAKALGIVENSEAGDNAASMMDAAQRLKVLSATRLDIARGIIGNAAAPVIEGLADSLDVSYHTFGSGSRLISDKAEADKKQLAGLKPTETSTSTAASLETIAQSGSTPPAGIILYTDGIDNGSAKRTEKVLRDLGARNIPVFPVPIGMASPDDLSIRNLVMQEVAFSGDTVPIQAQILSKGYEKRTAKLTVKFNGLQVATKTIRLQGGLQIENVSFNVDIAKKGAAKVEVAIEPFDDEVSITNNRIERTIRVVKEHVNVLYIEGNNRWEFRYISAILKRDPRLKTTFISSCSGPELARNSEEHIARFPSKRKDAFKYDLVILGDVDPAFFTKEELGLLEELIRDRGGSLLVLCGPMHTPTSYAGTPIETLMPLRFEPETDWNIIPESVYPVLTSEGRSSMVMVLENKPEQNDRVWSRVSPLDHLPPLLDPKPGATVLATLSDSTGSDTYPLVAWHRYGTGKCMSIATDRLWRLRFNTGDKYHWRVWSQTIQFLTLSRLMGEHKRIRLETDKTTYDTGEKVRLYAHVLDEEFQPDVRPSFDITVSGTDGNALSLPVKLQPDRTAPGLYEGYFTAPVAGRYRLESNEDDKKNSNSTEFQITEFNQELADVNTRFEDLERMAKLTGGKCLTLDDLDSLSTLIDTEPLTTEVRSERPLWDNWLVLLALVGLLGTEWFIRRKNDLT